MSKIPGPTETLQWLDDLKNTIEALSTRAEKLQLEFRSKSTRERQLTERALADHDAAAAESLGAAEAGFQDACASLEVRYGARKAWIGRAYQSSKEHMLERIENRIGGSKYELQKRALQAERDRDAGLAAATAHFEEFRRTLAAEQADMAALESLAQASFQGYSGLRRLLLNEAGAKQEQETESADSEGAMLARLREVLDQTGRDLARFRKRLFLRIFRWLPVWWILALIPVGLVPLLVAQGNPVLSYGEAIGISIGMLVLVFVARRLCASKARPVSASIARNLARARRLFDSAWQQSEIHHRQEIERVKTLFLTTNQELDLGLKRAVAEGGQARVSCRMEADERTNRINTRNDRIYQGKLQALETSRSATLKALRSTAENGRKTISDGSNKRLGELTARFETERRGLEKDWNTRLRAIYQALSDSAALAEKHFPPWKTLLATGWSPPKGFVHAAKFAQIDVDVDELCQMPAPGQETRLELPGPKRFLTPLSLVYPDQGCVLLETANTGHEMAVETLNNVILRLLSVAPPGRLNFTVIDPVGLGQNFAGVMHMADYEEQIIGSRIWTQSSQIEQRLANLNEHMEKVIQMYLRNEYATIAEYNEQAGVIAEKYHFLVVADFPVNFTDVAAKRLLSIAASGARCGVFTLIHWDRRQPLPQDFLPDELRKSGLCLVAYGDRFVIAGRSGPGADLLLDAPPNPEQATAFIQQVGLASRDSSRVEVPFEHVAPAATELWTEKTTSELRVPIGRTGATKLQYLEIGKGTRQHALIAGKTGSGKSTLFHVIITNLALWCSPEEVEFYLVDFKKGVEFKCYASRRLPHARVVAIESDREFGLSVLQRVDDELRRRGDLFRKMGVQDIPGYKRAGGTEPVPRSLLIIDEFQEFFVEDDKISQTASLLLDRIVRQGRAFGIHVLLGSQTLGGAYTVARTTLGQMVIRVALQCNEADAYLIMDDSNPAPRLLSRPGEGIYNDAAGAVEGNSPFQVVWLPDEVRDHYLAKARQHADATGREYPGPIVFEGNAPAEVRENGLLRRLLAAEPAKAPAVARVWLGAPNSIKGPTEAVFHRQSGNHLLIVGQREEAILAIFSVAAVALAAQYPPGAARILLLDSTPPGTPERDYLERLAAAIPQVTLLKAADLPAMMKDLLRERKERAEAADPDSAPPVFFLIRGLQKFSRLRYEEDFSFSSGDDEAEVKPGAVLNDLILEGARLGFHVIASCDTYNNINRYFSRKTVSEFEMRVLFQMSANDSASLIDSPKASMLGLHRALFYNAQEGYLETFRPYALPPGEWIDEARQRLSHPAQSPQKASG